MSGVYCTNSGILKQKGYIKLITVKQDNLCSKTKLVIRIFLFFEQSIFSRKQTGICNMDPESEQAENQQTPAAASAMATSMASINSQVPLHPNFVTTGDLAYQCKK